MKLFAENPEIRPYFYEGKKVDKDNPLYNKIMSNTEIKGDFFEHIALQKPNLPNDVWKRWINYVLDINENSPVLRQYYEENHAWYSDDILKLLKGGRVSSYPF